MYQKDFEIKKITKYANSYLLHKSITNDIENLVGNIDCIKDMIKDINYYKTIDIDTIYNNCDYLTEELERTMKHHYNNFTKLFDGKTPENISDEVFSRMLNNKYCFSGGFGHRIFSDTVRLHPESHWCIKPAFYDTIKPSPYEKIALKITRQTLYISDEPKMERWDN